MAGQVFRTSPAELRCFATTVNRNGYMAGETNEQRDDPPRRGIWILVGVEASRRKDGRAGVDDHRRLWEVETGKELAKMRGAVTGFYSLAISGDGRRLAAGRDDGTVTLWDMTRVRNSALPENR